jgi:hypothetical protein
MIEDYRKLVKKVAWGARGRKFESCHPDIENQPLTTYCCEWLFS